MGFLQKIDLYDELQEVYIHSFLFKLAQGLIGIFIPLYIIEQGLGIETVLVYFAIYYLTHLLGPVPFGFLSSKIGYKHTSLLSSVLILGFYLVIRVAETSEMFYLASLVGGFGFIMYWMGMNPEMAVSSDEGEEESEVGTLFSLPSLASVAAPGLGGIVLFLTSFDVLFVFAGSLMFLSFGPFILSSEHSEGMSTDIGDVFNFEMVFDFATFFFKGFIYFLETVLWPLYLALVIGGSLDIGFIGTVYALGAAVASLLVGRYMNTENKNWFLYSSGVLAAIATLGMAFVESSLPGFVVASLHGIAFTALSMSIYSSGIKRAQRTDIIEYFAFREISLALGRIAALGLVFLIFYYVGENFLYAFSVIAAATIVTSLVGEKILE